MAFSGMTASGARGRGRWRGGGSLSEMNVVPLVDVVLVLLIIFMVTASAIEFGLDIQVPKVKGASQSVQDAPVVSISSSGTTYVKNVPVNINVLAAEIRRTFGNDVQEVYIRADKDLTLEPYLQVVAALGEAKFNVKLVTKREDLRLK